MDTWIIIILVIGIVAIMAALTMYMYYYNLLHSCRIEPNIQCFTDYVCKNPIDPARTCPAQFLYGVGPGEKRQPGFCDDPANYDKPGCRCRKGSDGQFLGNCNCEFVNFDQSLEGAQSGIQLCNGEKISKVEAP